MFLIILYYSQVSALGTLYLYIYSVCILYTSITHSFHFFFTLFTRPQVATSAFSYSYASNNNNNRLMCVYYIITLL